MKKSPPSIENNFVVISPEKITSVEKPDSGLYERLEKDYAGFKGHELISCHEFDRDWSSWEIHPHGDEVVILLSGNVKFVLELEEGNKEIELSENGMYAIVPKNVWHTAKTKVKTKMLFITPGEGTKHKNV